MVRAKSFRAHVVPIARPTVLKQQKMKYKQVATYYGKSL